MNVQRDPLFTPQGILTISALIVVLIFTMISAGWL
jgi:hypothetical protein